MMTPWQIANGLAAEIAGVIIHRDSQFEERIHVLEETLRYRDVQLVKLQGELAAAREALKKMAEQ